MAALTNIDSIVRSALLTEGLPIHYYMQFLHLALKCVKHDIGYDTLANIKPVRLTVSAQGNVTLPVDFVGVVKVGIEKGKYIQTLSEVEMNKLPKYDGGGNETVYPKISSDNDGSTFYDPYYTANVNSKGESLGRMYGLSGGSRTDVYSLNRERGAIEFDPAYINAGDIIYLEYMYFDSAMATSMVNPFCEAAIEAYVIWRWRDFTRTRSRLEMQNARKEYYNALRKARAALNSLSMNDILRTLREHFKQSIKI